MERWVMADQEKNATAPAGTRHRERRPPSHAKAAKPAPVKSCRECFAWKVLLHNDDKNDIIFVMVTIIELTP